MATGEVIKTTCEFCIDGCGVLVHMSNGKPVRVEGDPDYPVNKGALCAKALASLEYLYSPDRLKYPQKRLGKRGEGKWQRISWDEALDTIASELNKTREKYGPESIVFIRGCAKGHHDSYFTRFVNYFGLPNSSSMAHTCFQPRFNAALLTMGTNKLVSDYEYPPACIIMWGVNTSQTIISDYVAETEALKKGAKLIVIDPAETEYTVKADIWVKPRPSTDLALALGMLNVIINENLYDTEFVEKWTSGFDRLKTHVQDYPPEKVERITWVPADTVREIARLYATSKPACINIGNGIDTNINNFQCARALHILRAITGNIGKPGSEVEWLSPEVVVRESPLLRAPDALKPEARARRISLRDGIMPICDYALPQSWLKAIATSDPYPIRTVFFQGCDPIQTYANAQDTRQALEKLGFVVVADFFMTPTAELADIVLPVGTYLEIDSVHESQYIPYIGVIQKVEQIGECWSDYRILMELAKRLGFGEHFRDEKKLLDYILEPAGITFDEFRKVRVLPGKKLYRRHEKTGFNTPSKKVEIYSSRLKEWGFNPLPVYYEPPESPYSEPELAKEYPLVLTNRKFAEYQHSGGRQIPSLRRSHPEPVVKLNSETAAGLGIKEGDWVYIETRRGRIKQKASLTPIIDPRVIIADYGWWFPEKPASELHGYAESNINILTSNKPPFAREMGTITLKGFLCKVYKVS